MRDKKAGKKTAIRLALAILLTGSLVVVMIMILKGTFKKQVVGEYISWEEVNVLLNELECDVQVTEDVKSTDKSADTNETADTEVKQYLTYQEYIQVLNTMAQTHPEVFTLEEKERFENSFFEASYAKRHMLLKSDFLKSFYALAELFVPQKEIHEASFMILGGTDEVSDLEGQAIQEGKVLAADGVMALSEIEFAEYKSFLYQSVKAVMSKDRVVLPLQADETEFSLEKAWIFSNTEEGLKVNYKGRMITFPHHKEVYDSFEEIADLTFESGVLKEVSPYNEKVSGKLLGVTEEEIQLEEVGNYEYAEDIQVYKLYGEKEAYTLKDLKIGYNFTDFVLDGDEIIAALVTKEESMESIRVAIKTNDFAGIYHESVSFVPDCDYMIYAGNEEKEGKAGEKISLDAENWKFEDSRIKIVPKVLTGNIAFTSLQRAQGIPSYRGMMEVQKTKEGLVIVNELLLEEYLYSVVPSEMPSSYPMEALKAQAVTARTYAYKNMMRSGLPAFGAHVDDSVSYQVYNNIISTEPTTLAVRETKGQILEFQGKPADTYYYSTSCGYSTDMGAWGSEVTPENAYLAAKHIATESIEEQPADNMCDNEAFARMIQQTNEADFEKDMDFYRWSYETKLDADLLYERIKERYDAKTSQVLTLQEDGSFVSEKPGKPGKIQAIEVLKRSKGGAVCELLIRGRKKSYKIISEYNVRYILRNESTEIMKNNGKTGVVGSLLPSAFFSVETQGEKEVEGYTLTGGGYGHGIGMSQNGAKGMGEAGYSFEQILKFFYSGIEIMAMNKG